MRIFVSGGCKNGKSYFAQHAAKNQQTGNLYYVATMKPSDKEDGERIARHVNEREGWGFQTIEQFLNISEILKKADCAGSFLLDSTTALLANEMFLFDPAFGDFSVNENAAEKISSELSVILDSVENIVIVSDYIYSDAEIYGELTEKYRKSLAFIDRECAKRCDAVIEIAYTSATVHKGKEEFCKIYEKIF